MALSRRTLFLFTITPFILFLLLYRLEFNIILFPDLSQLASGSRALTDQLSALLHTPTVSVQSGLAKPFVRHIVAVGDLHGDFRNARRVLQFSGIVDEYGNWTGHADFFVQTGDIIDRWVLMATLALNTEALPQAGTIQLHFLTGWINCAHRLCQRAGLY